MAAAPRALATHLPRVLLAQVEADLKSDALTDIASLAFQIFDLSGHDKRANPVQVYPATAGDRAPVNTTDLWPTGDKLAIGHYVARGTAPAGESLGLHEIRGYGQCEGRIRVAPGQGSGRPN